jgi:hypothetical protein
LAIKYLLIGYGFSQSLQANDNLLPSSELWLPPSKFFDMHSDWYNKKPARGRLQCQGTPLYSHSVNHFEQKRTDIKDYEVTALPVCTYIGEILNHYYNQTTQDWNGWNQISNIYSRLAVHLLKYSLSTA